MSFKDFNFHNFVVPLCQLGSANNFAMKAKRKTLNAADVLAAMEEMEFERFLEPLREALEGVFVIQDRYCGEWILHVG